MKCTCDHARREARAEAFREAARWHMMHARWIRAGMIRRDFGEGDEEASSHQKYADHFLYRAAAVAPTRPGAGAGAAIPVPPVSGNPETASPLSGPPSAAMDLPEDESLSAAIAKLVEDDGFITEWPDSYPFRDLDPWPENPAEACK